VGFSFGSFPKSDFGSAANAASKSEDGGDTKAPSFVFGTSKAATAAAMNEPEEDNTTTTKAATTEPVLPEDYIHQSGEENETVLIELRCKSWHLCEATRPNNVDATATTTAAVPHSESALSTTQAAAAKE